MLASEARVSDEGVSVFLDSERERLARARVEDDAESDGLKRFAAGEPFDGEDDVSGAAGVSDGFESEIVAGVVEGSAGKAGADEFDCKASDLELGVATAGVSVDADFAACIVGDVADTCAADLVFERNGSAKRAPTTPTARKSTATNTSFILPAVVRRPAARASVRSDGAGICGTLEKSSAGCGSNSSVEAAS
jgi:hypothetical protein